MKLKKENVGKIRNLLIVALALVLVTGLFCGVGAAAELAWSSYDGLQSGTYTISDATHSTLSHKTTLTVSQDAVLDFGSGKTYTLVGSTANDGCGGLVDILAFNASTTSLTIKNLHITGSGTISSTSYGIGILFGRINSAGTLIFENCSINGVGITLQSKSANVGALVGHAGSSGLNIEVKNCIVENCSIVGQLYNVGGLVGQGGSASIKYENCVVDGCTICLPRGDNVGGLVGVTSGSQEAVGCVVKNCYIYASYSADAGGLVGYVHASCKNADLNECVVENCVIYGSTGFSGGIVGCSDCNSGTTRTYTDNTVRNSIIHSGMGATKGGVGGIIGGYSTSAGTQTCTGNTVEYCTIVDGYTGTSTAAGVGGIASKFPSAGTLSGNKVFNTCVVSKKGNAAGICPVAS